VIRKRRKGMLMRKKTIYTGIELLVAGSVCLIAELGVLFLLFFKGASNFFTGLSLLLTLITWLLLGAGIAHIIMGKKQQPIEPDNATQPAAPIVHPTIQPDQEIIDGEATNPARLCSSCGEPVNPQAKFCDHCGAEQEISEIRGYRIK